MALCVPAGKPVADPLNLLASNQFKLLLNELKTRYQDRYILLDAPPVIPFADVGTLGDMVDNILFVCREGYSKLDQIEEGLGILKDYSLLGIVCNDINMLLKTDYSYYGGFK